jgi:peptidoglycan/LPS O-acetylase OafA/YrhL
MGQFSPKSIDSLTSLRGILALWVVAYHFGNDACGLFPSTGILMPLVRQGHYAVPIFFMLSGFVLAYNYADKFLRFGIKGYREFVFIRLARIYPVHLFTLFLVLGMVIVCSAKGWPITDSGYTFRDFVLNLLLVQTWVPVFQLNWNYPSWSISSEWFAYLFFPLFCATFLRKINTRPRAYFFLAATWGATVGLYVVGNGLPFRQLLCVIPTFLAGTAIFACLSHIPHQPLALLRFLPDILLLFLAIVPLLVGGPLIVVLLLTGFLALIYLLVYQEDNCSRLWTNRLAVYLGEVSYSLYMAHTLGQKVCYKLLPSERFAASGSITRLAIIFIYIIFIATFSLGTYYLVEKPSRWRLRQLLFRASGQRLSSQSPSVGRIPNDRKVVLLSEADPSSQARVSLNPNESLTRGIAN